MANRDWLERTSIGLLLLALASACASAQAPAPRTPDQLIQDGQRKLADIERHEPNEGMEFDAEKAQAEIARGQREKAEAEALAIEARPSATAPAANAPSNQNEPSGAPQGSAVQRSQ